MSGSFLIKRVVTIGLLVFVLLVLSALYFTSRAKTYTYEIQFLLTKSTSTLSSFKKKKADTGLKIFQQLKGDANQVREAINSRPTPQGGQQLKLLALEYVDMIEEIADRAILAYKYLAKISHDIKSWRQALKEIKQVDKPNEKAKIVARATEIIVNRFSAMSAPGYLSPIHSQLTNALRELADKSRAVYEAAEADDYITVISEWDEWKKSGRLVDNLFQQSVNEAAKQILPPDKNVRLKKLVKLIDAEIEHLQKLGDL